MFRFISSGVEATQSLAADIAQHVVPGDLLVLSGDLGAGKTAFTQGFGRALGVQERITSPTFTLVHEYSGRLAIHHLDVYRLSDPGEVYDLALPELLDDGGVTVIEWGNLVERELPRDYLDVSIALGDAKVADERIITVAAVGSSWVERVADMGSSPC